MHCATTFPDMANLTIRKLDDRLKGEIRLRAARRGHSMEEEARRLLEKAVAIPDDDEIGLAAAIHRRFAPLGGLELDLPPREPARDPPDFE